MQRKSLICSPCEFAAGPIRVYILSRNDKQKNIHVVVNVCVVFYSNVFG